MNPHIAYLVNQYPAVSHTFIRREIQALERQGLVVHRIALRGWDAILVDDADRDERVRTRYVLANGATGLVHAVLATLVTSPLKLLAAFRLALQMARQSDRPWQIHLVYLAEACLVRRWLSEVAAVHLHAHFATNPAEIAMLTHLLGGPPYSFTAHGSDITDRPAQMGLQLTAKNAAFVAAVCSFGRSQIFRWIPQELWPRVQIIRCGLDAAFGVARRVGAAPPRHFLCIGRLSKEKGQALLVEAASILARSGQTPQIVLAGDGPMRGEIEALIQREGLGECVRVTGWLDAAGIERELKSARALVVPSLSEGLPVVIMEAMAHRLPVIAPFLAGIPELVLDGTTGWLFPPSDVSSLADSMTHCMEADPSRLKSMGDLGARRVREMHDSNTEAVKLVKLIQASIGATTIKRKP